MPRSRSLRTLDRSPSTALWSIRTKAWTYPAELAKKIAQSRAKNDLLRFVSTFRERSDTRRLPELAPSARRAGAQASHRLAASQTCVAQRRRTFNFSYRRNALTRPTTRRSAAQRRLIDAKALWPTDRSPRLQRLIVSHSRSVADAPPTCRSNANGWTATRRDGICRLSLRTSTHEQCPERLRIVS